MQSSRISPVFVVLFLGLSPSSIVADACDEVRRCCIALYNEMRSSGLTVPPNHQCDTALMIDPIARSRLRSGRDIGVAPCQEVLISYSTFAYSLWREGQISLIPPECDYDSPPFEMEHEPPDFELESEPSPEPFAPPAEATPDFDLIFGE